jgi:molybdenum cofactor guanylyltransferase
MADQSEPRRLDRRSIAGVVLAGGRSSRMAKDKAFVALAGRSLIERALERLRPQLARLYVNAPENAERYAALDLPLVVDDPRWRGLGPLAGIAAALARARAEGFEWVATTPCDAPFLPRDLVARLAAPIETGEAMLALAVSAFGPEPMFGLWSVGAAEGVEAALAAGYAGPRRLFLEWGAAQVVFPADPGEQAFANLNTPEDLAAAEAALLDSRGYAL